MKRHHERLQAKEAEARALRGALASKQPTRESTVKSAKIVHNTAEMEITTVRNTESTVPKPSAVSVLAIATARAKERTVEVRRVEEDMDDDGNVEEEEELGDDDNGEEVEITSFTPGSGQR